MNNLALRFIRWGTGLLILGLISGYAPLGHYLMAGADPSCPAAPIHGHSILLGWVGMTLFGLVYRALPAWGNGKPPDLKPVRAHFYLAVTGTLGDWVNGLVGYELLNLIHSGFYYQPHLPTLQVWFGISGFFLTLYGIGCVLFLRAVLRSTAYQH